MLARAALVLVPIVVLACWVWWLGTERRAIRAMPPAERAALLVKTLQAFDAVCAPPRAGLTKHCRTQARFLLSFDECDASCQDRVRPLLRWRSG